MCSCMFIWKKWLLKFKLLYLLNRIICFNKYACYAVSILTEKVWKSGSNPYCHSSNTVPKILKRFFIAAHCILCKSHVQFINKYTDDLSLSTFQFLSGLCNSYCSDIFRGPCSSPVKKKLENLLHVNEKLANFMWTVYWKSSSKI